MSAVCELSTPHGNSIKVLQRADLWRRVYIHTTDGGPEMAVNTNAFTKAKQFRLPHDVCARLEQQESQTAFLVEALRAAFKRLDMQQAKAAKKQEGAE